MIYLQGRDVKYQDIGKTIELRNHPFTYQIENKLITKFIPQIDFFQGALLIPSSHNLFPQCKANSSSYDINEKPIYRSEIQRTKEGGSIFYQDCLTESDKKNLRSGAKFIGENSIYMGFIFHSFGHFIIESISRIWPLLHDDKSGYKFVFHIVDNTITKESLVHYGFDIYLNLLGIDLDNIILVDKPMVFRNIYFPDQAIQFRDSLSSFQSLIWNKISSANKGKVSHISDKIYLSRKSVQNPVAGRFLSNEKDVEDVFYKLGFDIVSPEELGDEKLKLQVMSNCNVLAGCCGSGLHNSSMMFNKKTIQLASIHKCQGIFAQHLIDHANNNKLFNYYSNIEDSVNGGWEVNTDKLHKILSEMKW